MSYSKIYSPKLSDVIEQQLEYLILEGTLRPGAQLPPERELAKRFGVSRPSVREAIQRLEAKNLLFKRQGGGTYVQAELWKSVSEPLTELLLKYTESQFDLLEARHALESISAYYAALRGTEEDRLKIKQCHSNIKVAQKKRDILTEADAVLQYQEAVTEASHNVVLLQLIHCIASLLHSNIKENLELLYQRRELLEQVNLHREEIFNAIMDTDPKAAQAASHRHLAFIEESLLALKLEKNRKERTLRRLQP